MGRKKPKEVVGKSQVTQAQATQQTELNTLVDTTKQAEAAALKQQTEQAQAAYQSQLGLIQQQQGALVAAQQAQQAREAELQAQQTAQTALIQRQNEATRQQTGQVLERQARTPNRAMSAAQQQMGARKARRMQTRRVQGSPSVGLFKTY